MRKLNVMLTPLAPLALPLALTMIAAFFSSGLLGALGWVGLATAATEEKITVTIAPSVQEQIQKLNPRERKRIEAAIRSGNRFIPRYLDGSAKNITGELSVKRWRKSIRPLVNKDFDKWSDMLLEKQSGLELEISKRKLTDYATVCPQAELISFQDETRFVNLRYRIRVIGIIQIRKKTSPSIGEPLINAESEYQEAVVGLDNNNKIDYVEEKYLGLFVTTDFYIKGYKTAIEFQGHRLSGTTSDEQMRAKEEIHQYKKWIKLISEQEAAVCKKDELTSHKLMKE